MEIYLAGIRLVLHLGLLSEHLQPAEMNFLFIFTIFFIHGGEANLVAWLLGRESSASIPSINVEEPTIADNSLASTSNIPFELSSADEKFIADAQKYTELKLSDLDICQHKLILQMKQDCNELTEENLSKLGVNLLNCQSETEGRAVYPCSSSMSLEECTGNMDSDTWNAYHILSNRARSVCYAARQQQFRALAQMTVNKLMASSRQQLGFIQQLKAEHEELGYLAAETLGSLTKGQQKLSEQQNDLKSAQQFASEQISVTIRELSRERTAAYVSHRQLSTIGQTLKETLKQASQMALQQENERQSAQQNLQQSLASIEGRISDLWNQLENRVEKLLVEQQQAVDLQSHTVETLLRLNETFQFLLKVSEHSQKQLDWIQSLAATTEQKLGNLSTWVVHVCYFLFGMLLLSFTQAPSYTRCLFLVMVPLNLMMDLHQGVAMQLPALITLLVLFSLLYRCLSYLYSRPYSTQLQCSRSQSIEYQALDDSNITELIADDASVISRSSSVRTFSHSSEMSIPSLTRLGRSSNRRNCSGQCVDGSTCRNTSMKDSAFCWKHKMSI